MRRKVVSVQCVHGYKGYASTCMTLECGHEKWFSRDLPWQCKRKTTDCADCDRKCVDCDKLGALRVPCPYASEIHGDDTPIALCRECYMKRQWEI